MLYFMAVFLQGNMETKRPRDAHVRSPGDPLSRSHLRSTPQLPMTIRTREKLTRTREKLAKPWREMPVLPQLL